MRLELHLELESDATFGRGDGVAGLVDQEVEHDAATGLPYLRGRTLKGLLVEECANLLYSLERQQSPALDKFRKAAQFLFGQPGSTLEDQAMMRVGPAVLPRELREAVAAEVRLRRLEPAAVLDSITAIRRQTAVDDATGAPEEGSLRAMRVVLRQTRFISSLDFDQEPDADALALLAACILSLRRAGTGRNRGRGRLSAYLYDEQGGEVTASHLSRFKQLVEGVS